MAIGTCKHGKSISGSCPRCDRVEPKPATIKPGFYWMMQSGKWTVARISNNGIITQEIEVLRK